MAKFARPKGKFERDGQKPLEISEQFLIVLTCRDEKHQAMATGGSTAKDLHLQWPERNVDDVQRAGADCAVDLMDCDCSPLLDVAWRSRRHFVAVKNLVGIADRAQLGVDNYVQGLALPEARIRPPHSASRTAGSLPLPWSPCSVP
jgi:hypothetical protein